MLPLYYLQLVETRFAECQKPDMFSFIPDAFPGKKLNIFLCVSDVSPCLSRSLEAA